MGMCLADFGNVSIEVRRESFIIHAGPMLRNGKPDERWIQNPHPELPLEELYNLIEALKDAKRYLQGRRQQRPNPTKKPTRSQMIALEDTINAGDPWARVYGQSMHGGWHGVMSVLQRNKWIRYDEQKKKFVITAAGQAAYDADMLRQRTEKTRA
jgi:hypothetical protein